MKKKISSIGGRHKDNPLQQARLRAGLSQDRAVDILDCGIRTLQRYENGTRFPDWRFLMKMKECYNCEYAELFPDGSETKNLRMEDEGM